MLNAEKTSAADRIQIRSYKTIVIINLNKVLHIDSQRLIWLQIFKCMFKIYGIAVTLKVNKYFAKILFLGLQ